MRYHNGEMCHGSCGDSGSFRRFLTKEEKIEFLKEHQSALEKEAKGVSEKIAKLKKD